MKYNGWTNKETWLVNLWLGEYITEEQEAGMEITSDHLRATVENMRDDTSPLWGLFSDLLEMALASVNWEEIAAHYKND